MTDYLLCPICCKSFDSTFSLGGHVGSHSRFGSKRVGIKKCVCLQCDKKFEHIRKRKYCSVECFRQYISNKRKNKFYTVNTTHRRTVTLDVTVGYIEKYKDKQRTCEICNGIIRLAVDHDHKNDKFRGILCYSCNTQLGWYEKYQKQINKYLSE